MPGDIKTKYLPSVTLVDSGLNSLAASSTLVAGYETNAIDVGNISGGPPNDIILSGHFRAGSANHSAGQIEVWAIGAENDTPVWPERFDGTANTVTVLSRNHLFAAGKLVSVISGDSVNDRNYTFSPTSVASLFGGVLPDQFLVFVTHNIHAGANTWGSTGHAIYYTPVMAQYT